MQTRTRNVLLAVICAACAVILWMTYNNSMAADCDAGTLSAADIAAGRTGGKSLADAHMDQWKRKNPQRAEDWVAEEKERHKIQPPADNSTLLKGEQGKGHQYGQYTERDILTWAREVEKMVVDGSRIFHDAGALGSTVAVSCDMCHPDASNTHPETYPKFQAQMGRVALLRDMINWCVEHPVRGKRFEADSREMRALEAYILAQRKGTPLNYGKH
jgi:thiosulfate dehydrogenase